MQLDKLVSLAFLITVAFYVTPIFTLTRNGCAPHQYWDEVFQSCIDCDGSSTPDPFNEDYTWYWADQDQACIWECYGGLYYSNESARSDQGDCREDCPRGEIWDFYQAWCESCFHQGDGQLGRISNDEGYTWDWVENEAECAWECVEGLFFNESAYRCQKHCPHGFVWDRNSFTCWSSFSFDVPACKEDRSWRELGRIFGDSGADPGMVTGGLGALMVDNFFEAWVCLRGHECLSQPEVGGSLEDFMCFIYDEVFGEFLPWGKNSDLLLVDPVSAPASMGSTRGAATGSIPPLSGGNVLRQSARSGARSTQHETDSSTPAAEKITEELWGALESKGLSAAAEQLVAAGIRSVLELQELDESHIDLMMPLYQLPLLHAVRLKRLLSELAENNK